MAKRQPEKRKKMPSIDLQVTAATFTWAILLPLGPWGSRDSFRESVLGRVLSAASDRKSNSLRGLNKEAGWLQAEVSPCSQGTAKNPGSFHLSTNPPSICQLYPLAGWDKETETQRQSSCSCYKHHSNVTSFSGRKNFTLTGLRQHPSHTPFWYTGCRASPWPHQTAQPAMGQPPLKHRADNSGSSWYPIRPVGGRGWLGNQRFLIRRKMMVPVPYFRCQNLF